MTAAAQSNTGNRNGDAVTTEHMNRGVFPKGTCHYTTARRKTKAQAKKEQRMETRQAERTAQADWILHNLADHIEKLRKADK